MNDQSKQGGASAPQGSPNYPLESMRGRQSDKRSERRKRVANLEIEVPHLPDVEKTTLSCGFRDEGAFQTVTELLTEDAFHDPKNKILFGVLQDHIDRGMTPDMQSVKTLLRMRGREDVQSYAVDVFSEGGFVDNVTEYCLILLEQEAKRGLLDAATEALGGLSNPQADVFDLQRDVEEAVMKSHPSIKGFGPEPVAGKGQEVIDGYREAAEQKGITGTDTGFEEINKYTHGWQDQKSYVIAGASSMGKTTLAVNFVRKMLFGIDRAKAGDPVRCAYFTAENPPKDIAEKILAAELELDIDKAKEGKLYDDDYRKLEELSARLDDMPLWIDFDSRMHIKNVGSRLRRLVRFEDVEIAVIDNLHKMQADREQGMTRERELATMSAEVKGLAEELGIPVLLLAQVRRSKAETGEKPEINHLRGSGMIENDADVVAFIYRAEYYGISEEEDLERSTENLAELIWRKNRGGKRNVSSWLSYYEKQQRFANGKPKVSMYQQAGEAPF